MTILVAGATGGTGQQIMLQLLTKGETTRALVRDVTRARSVLGEKPDLIVGDVTVPATLPAAFADVTHCICTIGSNVMQGKQQPKDIDYQGVANLVDAAKDAQIQHMVLVSSIGATQPDHPINKYGRVMEWKLEGENYLRASGLNYTVVRPGGLVDEEGGTQGIAFGQGDYMTGRIPRADVAAVCLAALGNAHSYGITFEIISNEMSPITDYNAIFDTMEKDK